MNRKDCSLSIVGYRHTKSPKIFIRKKYGKIEINRVEYKPVKV